MYFVTLGVFHHGRMVIAVTKFDSCVIPHPLKHNQITAETAQQLVCQQIASAIGTPFDDKQIVVPVCSEWALYARLLEKYPDRHDLREYANDILKKCPNVPRGENEDLVVETTSSLATKLQRESYIDNLEERLVCSLESYSSRKLGEDRNYSASVLSWLSISAAR